MDTWKVDMNMIPGHTLSYSILLLAKGHWIALLHCWILFNMGHPWVLATALNSCLLLLTQMMRKQLKLLADWIPALTQVNSMGQPQVAAPHLWSNCRMKLSPHQVQSSMDLLNNSSRRKARRQRWKQQSILWQRLFPRAAGKLMRNGWSFKNRGQSLKQKISREERRSRGTIKFECSSCPQYGTWSWTHPDQPLDCSECV